jgi:hypothetical protein
LHADIQCTLLEVEHSSLWRLFAQMLQLSIVCNTLGAAPQVANDGLGVAGVGFRAALLACKALDDSGNGYVSDVVACIDKCR